MDYEKFEPVTSGANGTIQNGLPLDGAAGGFQYRKFFDMFVPFATFGFQTGRVVKGKWKIRLRASDSKDKAGKLNGTILFEQEVELHFTMIVQLFGTAIGNYLWYPLDGGNGRVKTTICDGQTVDTDEDGKLEGWKFVDATRPTIYSEEGDVRAGEFDDPSDDMSAMSEFSLSEGRLWGAFQSARYRCSLPEGAVLEVVSDEWQFMRKRELGYLFAFKAGSSPAHFDTRTGQRYWAGTTSTSGKTQTAIYRSRRGLSPIAIEKVELAGVLKDTVLSAARITSVSGGELLCIGVEKGSLMVYESNDDAANWKKIMEKPADIAVLASCLSKDKTRYCFYGRNAAGKAAYAILKREKKGWTLSDSGEATGPKKGRPLPVRGVSTMEASEGDSLRIIVRDDKEFRILVSEDGGRTYTDEILAGEEDKDGKTEDK